MKLTGSSAKSEVHQLHVGTEKENQKVKTFLTFHVKKQANHIPQLSRDSRIKMPYSEAIENHSCMDPNHYLRKCDRSDAVSDVPVPRGL